MSKKFGTEKFYKDGDDYVCEINYKDHQFTGRTHCYPDDKEFERDSIGFTISEIRAEIKRLRFVRDQTMAELRAMKRLAATSHVVEGSNIEKHLNCEIIDLGDSIDAINDAIDDLREGMKDYIVGKERFWNFIKEKERKKRLNEV